MGSPKRIQRKLFKGWRMPPNTVYVGRGSKWGNPFRIGIHGDAQRCVALFERWFNPECAEIGSDLYSFRQECRDSHNVDGWAGFQLAIVAHHYLRGKNLACWCGLNEPCHADVILRIANEVQP